MLGHSQSVTARSRTEPSRRRAGWKVTRWHFTRAFIAVESVRELNVMMAFGYLLHRTPVYRQLMAAMLLHFASPNVFNAATSAIATLIANNSECHVSTRCAEMQLWSTSACLCLCWNCCLRPVIKAYATDVMYISLYNIKTVLFWRLPR